MNEIAGEEQVNVITSKAALPVHLYDSAEVLKIAVEVRREQEPSVWRVDEDMPDSPDVIGTNVVIAPRRVNPLVVAVNSGCICYRRHQASPI